MQTVFNGTYMGLNDPRYQSRTAFYQWFHKYVRSINSITDNGKDLTDVAKEWCENNDHEWREDGVYNMNIMSYKVAFNCYHCKIDIHQDSIAQSDCVTNDGDAWFCDDCRKQCPRPRSRYPYNPMNEEIDHYGYDSDDDGISSDNSIWGQMQIDTITAGGTEEYEDFGINWQPGWVWHKSRWEWTGMTCATPYTRPTGPPPSEMKSSEMWWGWAGEMKPSSMQ